VWSEDPDFALEVPAGVMDIARLGASLKIKVSDVRDEVYEDGEHSNGA